MRKTIAALSLSCALLMSTAAFANEGGPGALDAFKESHAAVTALVQSGAETEALQAQVDQLLDYGGLSTRALGGPDGYADRCGDRCAEYEALLAKLIRENYLRRIRRSNEGTVEYLKEHPRAKATKVDTKVTFTDEDGQKRVVSIDYVMHKVDGKWQVVDIITDGVSLAKTYKHELRTLYKEGGMDQVISTLKKKIDQLDAE